MGKGERVFVCAGGCVCVFVQRTAPFQVAQYLQVMAAPHRTPSFLCHITDLMDKQNRISLLLLGPHIPRKRAKADLDLVQRSEDVASSQRITRRPGKQQPVLG